jgi:hypothetical protein
MMQVLDSDEDEEEPSPLPTKSHATKPRQQVLLEDSDDDFAAAPSSDCEKAAPSTDSFS